MGEVEIKCPNCHRKVTIPVHANMVFRSNGRLYVRLAENTSVPHTC